MKSIAEIKKMILQANLAEFEKIADDLKDDARKGVQKILVERQNYFKKIEEEHLRIQRMIAFDKAFGAAMVAGVDEVGRGPLAGPVVTACVVMDFSKPILWVNDSKKLSKSKREELYQQIIDNSLYCSIGEADNHVIDERNILNATFMAMNSAIAHTQMLMQKDNISIDLLLVDGNQKIAGQPLPQKTIVKGDAYSYSIACASILAKVYRDRWMERMAEKYPEYDFASNVGYGTALHTAAIKKSGLSPIHRKSFCSNFIE